MSCTGRTARRRDERAFLADPGLDSVAIRSDIGGRLDRICAEQLSRPAKQCAHFVQLLLQPGISHTLKLPTPSYSHNSPLGRNTEAGQSTEVVASVDDGTLGRWRSSVGIRRGSASGELPENPSRFRPSALRWTARRG
jgi:hypothetical protein